MDSIGYLIKVASLHRRIQALLDEMEQVIKESDFANRDDYHSEAITFFDCEKVAANQAKHIFSKGDHHVIEIEGVFDFDEGGVGLEEMDRLINLINQPTPELEFGFKKILSDFFQIQPEPNQT